MSKAYRNINSHTRYRVRQWLCAKFKEQGQGKKRFSNQYLHQKLGLHQLSGTKRQRFVCERVRIAIEQALSESRVRENRPPGLMSGVWKRSMVEMM